MRDVLYKFLWSVTTVLQLGTFVLMPTIASAEESDTPRRVIIFAGTEVSAFVFATPYRTGDTSGLWRAMGMPEQDDDSDHPASEANVDYSLRGVIFLGITIHPDEATQRYIAWTRMQLNDQNRILDYPLGQGRNEVVDPYMVVSDMKTLHCSNYDLMSLDCTIRIKFVHDVVLVRP